MGPGDAPRRAGKRKLSHAGYRKSEREQSFGRIMSLYPVINSLINFIILLYMIIYRAGLFHETSSFNAAGAQSISFLPFNKI